MGNLHESLLEKQTMLDLISYATLQELNDLHTYPDVRINN